LWILLGVSMLFDLSMRSAEALHHGLIQSCLEDLELIDNVTILS
jgi:hypothetical protein